MKVVGRNEPCPCGPGRKYKNCCLKKDEERPRNAQAKIAEFYDETEGRGPAKTFVDFAQPLIDELGDTEEGLELAVTLAQIFWNLAIIKDERERINRLEDSINSSSLLAKQKHHLRSLALMMFERHRQIFPKMHKDS